MTDHPKKQKPHTRVLVEFIASLLANATAGFRGDEWLAVDRIFQKAGLPLRSMRAGRRPTIAAAKGKWTRVPSGSEWDLICHLFGIRSDDDLERVLDRAGLEKRTDAALPDPERTRLDSTVRRLARKETLMPPEATFRPPNRTRDLSPLIHLVSRAPSYLCRWYVARLISQLHLLAWEGAEAERKRARALGLRLGKAVTQPLGQGRPRAFSMEVFRHTAALYEKLKGDAFTFSKRLTTREAMGALRETYPGLPEADIALLVSTARSTRIKTPHGLRLVALRKRFSIRSDRHVYRLLTK